MAQQIAQEFIPLADKTSTLDVMKNQLSLGWEQAETYNIYNYFNLKSAERTDDVTSYLELNKRFPEVETPFTEDTSLAKAEVIAKNARDRQRRREIIANGDDSFATTALGFVSSLAAQVVDPVGIAAGIATAGAFKAAGITKAIAMGLNSKIALGVAEGVIGNIATEAAIVIPGQLEDQQNIDIYDNLVNVAVGGAAFPIMTGLAAKGLKWLTNLPLEKQHQVIAIQEAKLEAGNKVDLTPEEMKMVEDGVDTVNKQEIREKANAKEQSMYYDPEVQDNINRLPENLEEYDVVQRVNEKLDEYELNALEHRFSDEEMAVIKAERAEAVQKIELMDVAIRTLESCVGRS